MKILVCLENLSMDGCHRATVTVGNCLAKNNQVIFYSLASTPSFFNLEAPLKIAQHPFNSGKSFRESDPLNKMAQQCEDLISFAQSQAVDAVILTAGLLTSFAPEIKQSLPAVQLIAWMHNNFETYCQQYYRPMLKEFLHGVSVVDVLIVLTQHDLQKFLKYNHNATVIYNPIALQNLQDPKANLKEPLIVCVGRLDIPHKGWDTLAQVANHLPQQWKICLAGDGPDKGKLEEMISANHLEGKLILTGELADNGLCQLYRRASIFLATSKWEGLPLVLGEAMNFGLPIISTPNTGAKEYLEQNNTKYGILTSGFDSGSILEELLPLIEDPDLRENWRFKAEKRAADFKTEKLIQRWEQLLLSLNKSIV